MRFKTVLWREGTLAERNGMIVLAAFWILAVACGGESMDGSNSTMAGVDGVEQARWQRLAERKIYFGHQSVGRDIMKGLGEVLAENPDVGLAVYNLDESDVSGEPGFAHSSNGVNKQPLSKIEAFRDRMDSGLGEELDVAFFKFCYVDILADTDVDALFGTYRDVMAGLAQRYPETRFIHVTAPLTTVQKGPKAWVKKLLGRPVRRAPDNISRTRFNELMIQEYGEGGNLFDLSALESTLPDGQAVTFKQDGRVYPALAELYTYDGQHLNETGRRRIGEQLLVFLSKVGD
jgi:hypothetical protein